MKKKLLVLGSVLAVGTMSISAISCDFRDYKPLPGGTTTSGPVSIDAGLVADDQDYSKMTSTGDVMLDGAKQTIFYYIGERANDFEFRKLPKVQETPKNGQAVYDPAHPTTVGAHLKMVDQYAYSVDDTGKLILEGSSPVAITHGFYLWAKSHNYGMVDFSGSTLRIPDELAPEPKTTIVSPYEHHVANMNPCTSGYTMPYWDAKQWTAHINYLAMHGFDMSLSLVGTEAIAERVFKRYGVTDTELQNFFTGPAYTPWNRMGNLVGWDPNPYQHEWNEKQIALQHSILKEMDRLQMIPIAQGFIGFVPKEIIEKPEFLAELAKDPHYNGVPSNVLMNTSWSGFPSQYNAKGLKSEYQIYNKIGTEIIQEYQKEFGVDNRHYFLVDLFNEMAQPPAAVIKETALGIYNSFNAADPESVWVTQGWNFSNGRGNWATNIPSEPSPATDSFGVPKLDDSGHQISSGNYHQQPNEAFRSMTPQEIPDDRMMIISSAEDYAMKVDQREYNFDALDGYNNKSWLFSSIPNMGGNTPMQGGLRFYARGGLDALYSPNNRGNLSGYGTAPEGLENNSIIFEMISDVTWQPSINNVDGNTNPINGMPIINETDFSAWLANYVANRYKILDEDGNPNEDLVEFWTLLTAPDGIYDLIQRGRLFEYQKNPAPGTGSGTYNPPAFDGGSVGNKTRLAMAAFEKLNDFLLDNADNPMLLDDDRFFFRQDVSEVLSELIGIKIDELVVKCRNGQAGNLESARDEMNSMFDDLDRVLSVHPLFNIDRWDNFAERWGDNTAQKNYYRNDAQRVVSIWGDGGQGLQDYAGRTWAGIVKNWYKPRWNNWFDHEINGTAYYSNAALRSMVDANDWGSTPANYQPDFNEIIEIFDYYINY